MTLIVDGMPLELPLDHCAADPLVQIAPQDIDTLYVVDESSWARGRGIGVSTIWAESGGPPYFSLIADRPRPGPMRAASDEIRLRTNVADPVRVEILDAYGRSVRVVHGALVGAAALSISTRGLASGLYTLKTWSADYRLSYRFEIS